MTTIRAPAVAGSFYPGDSALLREMVSGMLAAHPGGTAPPKAIIVPHAGYIYSGPVAASAYSQVMSGRDTIRRVVLLGPSHRIPFHGLATSSAGGFTTPLGVVTVDQSAVRLLAALSQVHVLDQAHAWEHSLEVQLPFLQLALGDFTLVPLVVGEASAQEVSEVLTLLWDGIETLIVVSSDLSHYHDYATAMAMDRATSNAISALETRGIDAEHACGSKAVNGLLEAARQHGLRGETLDLRNSGDTAGPRNRVVGYGAYAFH